MVTFGFIIFSIIILLPISAALVFQWYLSDDLTYGRSLCILWTAFLLFLLLLVVFHSFQKEMNIQNFFQLIN